MNYKAIIFDLDGTIIDTETIWDQASRQLINKHNVSLDKETEKELFTQIHGLALHKSCLLIKEAAQLSDNLEDLIREKSAIAHALYRNNVRFIPGFLQFHGQLATYNLKSGIATNASAETAELTDKILNLRQFFGEHIYNVSHVNFANKPAPDLYLHAAKQLCVNPAVCIAIEDSTHGITAAKAAGMFCIGINTARNRQALAQADCIVDHYHEIDLPRLLGAIPPAQNQSLVIGAE
jgi:HAD superfamily hydrolase (TIGR01509 family)